MASGNNNVQIELLWSWLKYDIDQETQKAAKCLITNDPSGEITMEAQTADDQFDMDYCKRKVTEGCMKLQDALHMFFTGIKFFDDKSAEISLASNDRLLHDAAKWQINLSNFGSRRNVNSTLLANELHQYIVLYVLQEWCKMTHPTMEQNYVSRLTAEELRVKNIVYRKEVPARPAEADSSQTL